MTIGIIDFGSGNLGSIKKCLKKFNIQPRIIKKADEFHGIDKLILPGQGAFGNAMDSLESNGLKNKILDYHKKGKSILGICLGMQLLFNQSNEFDTFQGLGILDGYVERLNISGLKLPIIGWYKISRVEDNCDKGKFKCLKGNESFYFSHSMHCIYKGSGNCSYVNHNDHEIVASIRFKNIFATQFHPELSSKLGSNIIKEFLNLTY